MLLTKRITVLLAGLALLGVAGMGGCASTVQNVAVPGPEDRNAYQPIPMPKPLPPESTGEAAPGQPGQPAPQGNAAANPYMLPSEPAFVAAYQARRSPRLMVFVNRNITGDPLPMDQLNDAIKNPNGNYDRVGASKDDYAAIELSLIDYFNAGGQIDIKDSDMVRTKLDRAQVLRLENNDKAVLPILKQELNTDVLIQVRATPTSHSTWGTAVRLLAKAVSTTDGRILAASYVDMPLPMTKTNINVFTRYLADDLMGKMGNVWGNGGQAAWDPLEVRIYKAATIDDILKIKTYMGRIKGVKSITNRGMTGSANTSYGTLAVAYDGAPEDFYGDLKSQLDHSSGLKAVDLQANTIDLEVTGPMNLATTTTSTETTTTVRTSTTSTAQPINPAPPANQP